MLSADLNLVRCKIPLRRETLIKRVEVFRKSGKYKINTNQRGLVVQRKGIEKYCRNHVKTEDHNKSSERQMMGHSIGTSN